VKPALFAHRPILHHGHDPHSFTTRCVHFAADSRFKDKRQSERFKETAREVGADEPSDAFDRIIGAMGRPQKPEQPR